jgi:hypothetical protein
MSEAIKKGWSFTSLFVCWPLLSESKDFLIKRLEFYWELFTVSLLSVASPLLFCPLMQEKGHINSYKPI